MPPYPFLTSPPSLSPFPRSSVLAKDEGTAEMRAVSTPIREGAEAFLRVQYTAIARIAVLLSVVITLSYTLRPQGSGGSGGAGGAHGVGRLGNTVLGLLGKPRGDFEVNVLCFRRG